MHPFNGSCPSVPAPRPSNHHSMLRLKGSAHLRCLVGAEPYSVCSRAPVVSVWLRPEGSAKQGMCMNSSLGTENGTGHGWRGEWKNCEVRAKQWETCQISADTIFRPDIVCMALQRKGLSCRCQGDHRKPGNLKPYNLGLSLCYTIV